jgi:hypothetical protein
MGWTTRRSRFDPRQKRKDFSSTLCVQTASGTHPASCTMGTGGPFPGSKAWPGRDLDHSPPSNAEALGPTQSPVQWVPEVLSLGLNRGRGVTLTTHSHLVPRSRMSRSYTSPPCASMDVLWDGFTRTYFLLLKFMN